MSSKASVERTPDGFRITGEIDISNAADVGEALKGDPPHGSVLNLTGLEFMDSSGLAAIMNFAEVVGPELTLIVRPNGAVHRLVNLMVLPYRIQLEPDGIGNAS